MTLLPQVGVVTGAAGGIGHAVAIALASRGVDLVVTDRDEARLQALQNDARNLRGRMVAMAGDLSDPELPGRLCGRALEAFGGLGLLVNCSGYLKDARVEKMDEALFSELISINLMAPLRLIEAALPLLKEGRAGRVISLASRAWLGNFGSSGYSAAKGGLVGYTRARALSVAGEGVTINCIAPGFIDTPMARSLPAHILERVVGAIPVGRAGTVDDIAELVLFLASSGSGYITGQTLVACGGRSISKPIAEA
jgi:3-oxoacyl-[acyl-carrier protein] reductase